MVLRPGATHYEPIGWADANRIIADELTALDSPHDAIFYTSGRTANEAAFLYQLMIRAYGTNNMPDCSNMCHESSGSALTASIGNHRHRCSRFRDRRLPNLLVNHLLSVPPRCDPYGRSVSRSKRNINSSITGGLWAR